MTKLAAPINIFSGVKGLGAALTNPTCLSRRKGTIRNDYPVRYEGVIYPDAETAYQKLKNRHPQGEISEDFWKVRFEPITNLDLMVYIIAVKFLQHPRLIEAVEKRGGADWLKTCHHRTYAKTKAFQWWEGEGMDSPMIRCLVAGYQKALIEKIVVGTELAPVDTGR